MTVGPRFTTVLVFGLAYALSWLSAVLLAPVLLLAGLADVALGRWRRS